MKKITSKFISMVVFACIVASNTAVMAEEQESSANIQERKEPLRIALSLENRDLEKTLKTIAKEERIEIEILYTGSRGKSVEYDRIYTNSNKADVYIFENEQELGYLQANKIKVINLLTAPISSELQTIVGMVPNTIKWGNNSEEVYALPLGVQARGTLVNIEMLAGLLGTFDTMGLARNVSECSWQQWSQMVALLGEYLEKPKNIKINLGTATYTTPKYRAEVARPLKGIFANSTDTSKMFYSNTMYALFESSYENMQNKNVDEMAEKIRQPLESVFKDMKLQARYLGNSKNRFSNGEDFSKTETISAEQAVEIFTNGNALFFNGDTTQAFEIEKENKQLENKLIIIPTKVALENSKQTEFINKRFCISAQGYICVAETSNVKNAEKIVFRLLASKEGQEALLADLQIIPLLGYAPERRLAGQVHSAIAGKRIYTSTLQESEIKAIENVVGNWFINVLMKQEEMTEENQKEFSEQVVKALLLRAVKEE